MNNLKKKTFNIFLLSIIFFYPFFYILINNHYVYPLNFHKESFYLFLILFFLYSIIYFFFSKFYIIKIFISLFLIFFCCNFLLDINASFSDNNNYVLRTLIYSTLLIGLFFLLYKKYDKTLRYISIFLIISISIHFINYKLKIGRIFESDFQIQEKEFEDLKFNKKNLPNIYLILMDELTSHKVINELYNIDVKKIISNKNVNYFGAKSSTISTINTISNLFYEENVKYLNPKFKYPFYKKSSKNVPFLNFLIKNKYKIYFQGNQQIKCYEDIYKKCLFNKSNFLAFDLVWENTAFTNIKKNFLLDFKIFKNLLQNDYFYSKSDKNFSDYLEITKFNIFLRETDVYKNNKFYFIHNMGPHYPNRNIDCSLNGIDTKNKKNYYNNLICNLNELNKLINTITLKDLNSLIYIIGDHGTIDFYETQKWREDIIKKTNNHKFDEDIFRTKDVFFARYSNQRCINNLDIKLVDQIVLDLKKCLNNY